MKNVFLLLAVFTSFPLLGEGQQPLPEQAIVTIHQSFTPGDNIPAPLKTFFELMGGIRNATPQSAAAKAKAVRIFSELYETGNPEVKELLTHLALELEHLLKNRPFLLPKTKEHLVLMVLHFSQGRLQEALKRQGATAAHPGELSEAIYTALNLTFGDFWRKVFLGVGVAAGLGLVYYIYKKCSGPSTLSHAIDLGVALNKPYNPREKNTLVFMAHEIAETMHKERTKQETPKEKKEPGLLLLITRLFTHLQETDHQLFYDTAKALPSVLAPNGDPRK